MNKSKVSRSQLIQYLEKIGKSLSSSCRILIDEKDDDVFITYEPEYADIAKVVPEWWSNLQITEDFELGG